MIRFYSLRGWMLAAGLAYGLAVLAALTGSPRQLPTPGLEPEDEQVSTRPAVSPPAPRPVAAAPAAPFLGFALSVHHTEHFHLYLQAIDEMARLGFNALEVVTPVFQENGSSQQIQILTGPARGSRRDLLVSVLWYAKQRGMTTTLMPVVLFTHPRGSEWRGKISPDYWAPWWASYRQTTDYFLEIANEAQVDIYCVGSELLSTEGQVQQWEELIAHVRTRFPGRLTYSTNWDRFHVPTLWRHLDLIGISGYWNLAGKAKGPQPTDQELAQRWGEIRRNVLAFARAQGKPVVLTELGFPSLPWALEKPWNYIADGQAATPEVQARGYRSFLTAWGDLLQGDRGGEVSAENAASPLAGVYFYEWSPYFQGGPQDTGYGVRGKPALDLLTEWMASRDRLRMRE